MKRVKALLASTMILLGAAKSAGAVECPSSNMLGAGLISNVCWSCIFPLRISGWTIFGSPQSASGSSSQGFPLSSRPSVPDGAANDKICICTEDGLPKIGLPLGMWLPTTLYETTMTPGCSSVLGGVKLGIADPLYRGTSGTPTEDLAQQSFNHIHLYSYPILMLMDLFTKCETAFSDIDVLYMSEIDPMWNDPIISLYGNPLSVFGSSLMAQAACAADAVSSSVGKPIDQMFWCGGTWTSTMAPFTGFEHAQGPVQFASSTSLKMLAMNVARGITRKKKGDEALCKPYYAPMIERGDYRWQVAWPRAEGRRNHGTGESLLRWGAGRTVPGVADLPIFLLWEWTDCCSPFIGG